VFLHESLDSEQQRDYPEHEKHEIAPLYLPPPPAFNLRLMYAGLKRQRSTPEPSSIKPRRSARLRKTTNVHILKQDSSLYREDLIKKSCIPRTHRTTRQKMKQTLKENGNEEDAQHKYPRVAPNAMHISRFQVKENEEEG